MLWQAFISLEDCGSTADTRSLDIRMLQELSLWRALLCSGQPHPMTGWWSLDAHTIFGELWRASWLHNSSWGQPRSSLNISNWLPSMLNSVSIMYNPYNSIKNFVRNLLHTCLHHRVCYSETLIHNNDDIYMKLCIYGCVSSMFSFFCLFKSALENNYSLG